MCQKKYSDLIAEEKANPQQIFNKTFRCPQCGYCHYEGWETTVDQDFAE